MKTIQVLSFGISKYWLVIGASLLYGIILGYSVSQGMEKSVGFLLLPTLILVFRTFSERFKIWILALSIPLSLVQIPSLPLPYGTSISEAILIVLALDEILFQQADRSQVKPVKPVLVISLGLFCFAGLIANLNSGAIYTWNAYCLLPLILFFVISRKIHDQKDAWLFVEISLLTIVGFIAIVELAIVTGRFEVYDPLHTEVASGFRMANGMMIVLGPIRLITFATRIGAIAALGLPTCIMLWMKNNGNLWWKIVLLSITGALIYVLVLSATRGSVIAAALGVFLIILMSGRFRSPVFIAVVVLSLLALPLMGEIVLNLLPVQNIQRLLTLSQGVDKINNYQQRMDVLSFAWDLTIKNPLGVGFGYLYSRYQIDDAIIYANILEGTGILGAIAFIVFVVHWAFQFGLGVLKSPIGSTRDLASLGLSTLAVGLVAGVSSQSIMFEPVHAFVFWGLMAVCYCAVVCFSSRFISNE